MQAESNKKYSLISHFPDMHLMDLIFSLHNTSNLLPNVSIIIEHSPTQKYMLCALKLWNAS